jgi:hypothetical protein
MTFHSIHAFLMNVQFGIEWIYLFKNNSWYVAETKMIKMPNGRYDLATLHDKDFTPLWAYFTKHNIAVGDQS